MPEAVAPADEAAYLHPFNQHEARAWVGLDAVAYRLFGIEWALLPARDVGTYGFAGGNALVDVPAGYRRVAHFDRQHHARRYHALAQQARGRGARLVHRGASSTTSRRGSRPPRRSGARSRPATFPPPREVARIKPQKPGRNDLCICGSMRKWKHCCGAQLVT